MLAVNIRVVEVG